MRAEQPTSGGPPASCYERHGCELNRLSVDELFEELGGGLWLLFRHDVDASATSAEPLGMCGFIRFLETGSEPQLVYALRPEHTGRGYATEAARAVIEQARDVLGLSRIISAADEPNVRSIRVLEGLGFVRSGHYPGTFGRILAFALPLDRPPR